MKKRVASIVAVYPPYGGGLGVVARENAQMLAGDYDVTIFTPRYGRIVEPARQDGAVSIRFIRPFFSYGNAAVLPQLIVQLRSFDAIHLHYPFFGACIPTILAALLWRKKLIITYHMDLIGVRQPFALFFLISNAIAPFLVSFAHRILVTSRDYAESSAIADFVKKHPEKITELPNSVDADVFRPVHNEPREEKTILFVGGLDSAHYFKGVEVLLRACEIISATMPFRLEIVGDGNLKIKYELEAEHRGLFGRVHFTGQLGRLELSTAMTNADLLVLPSRDRSEAFGVVLIEAGACGTPAIASDLPGVRSVIEDGVTGLLAKPGDADSLAAKISELLNDPSRLERMGAAARQHVLSMYSNTTVGDTLRIIFGNLCSETLRGTEGESVRNIPESLP